MFYNHNIRWEGESPIITKAKGKKIPFNFNKEPLYNECKAFINWLSANKKPPSDIEEGIKVLEVLDIAKKISPKSNLTIKIGKKGFYKQLEMPLGKAYDYTSKMMTLNMSSYDAKEGISAFIEKRNPSWKNK